MNIKQLNEFLRDLSFNTEYRFLEQGKDDSDLQRIAEKRGLSLPATDLAIFKGKYAFTDRTNLNGCSLPTEEVKKSLPTLFGKAIDFDHIRERIVGFWLDAELDGDTIYAYGAFFKTNLADDYTIVKDLMDKKNLAISFEAYGKRSFKSDGTYDLNDIEWAGGALLINTKPAFPGAGVLEMSNKKVLEFANTMTEPKDYIKPMEEKKLEKSRMYVSDMETILRLCSEAKCPMCNAQGAIDLNCIDLQDNEVEATCWMCNCNMEIELTPQTTMMPPTNMASRTIKSITKIEKKGEIPMSVEKIEATPSTEQASESVIKDEETIVVTEEAKVEEVAEATEEVKTEVVTEEAKDMKKCPTCETMVNKDKLNQCSTEEVVKVEATKEQLQKARDEGKVIGERRAFLGDFAKDMTDEDVLDNVKYENATLKKKLASVEKDTKQETASTTTDSTLVIGSKDKNREQAVDTLAKNVRQKAFGPTTV